MSPEEDRETQATIRRLVDELHDTPAGERLRDRRFRLQHASEALSAHPDPIMREIGQQLRDGSMRPADVLRVPAYADAFRGAADDAATRLDPKRVAGELAELVGSGRTERWGGPGPETGGQR